MPLTIVCDLCFQNIIGITILIFLIETDGHHTKRTDGRRKFRIIGGRPADIEDFPFIVSLVYRPSLEEDRLRLICGAVIIQKYWALTAAHCLKPLPPNMVKSGRIFLRGNASYWDNNIGRRHSDHLIATYHKHSEYLGPSNSFDNDIGLLKYVENSTAITLGWGITKINSTDYSPILKRSTIVFTKFRRCQKIYKSIGKVISSRMLCAGAPKTDSCSGDSGGPMIQNNVLVGIISWGAECVSDRWPGIYTKISKYPKWISDNMKKIRKSF